MPSARAMPVFLLAILFAPMSVIAPKGLVPLLFVGALWLLIRRLRQGQAWRPFAGVTAIAAAAVAAWALLSALWALDGTAALITFAKLAGVCLSALIVLDSLKDLDHGDRQYLGWVLVGAFVLAALLLAGEGLSGLAGHKWLVWQGRRDEFDLTVLNRAEALLLLSAWPAALVLWQQGHRIIALAAVAVAAAVIMLGVSNSNQAALLLALPIAALACWAGPWLQRLLAVLVAIGTLAAPLLPATVLAPERMSVYFDENHYSGLHRLHIWHFASQRITEAPVLGWGLDAARRIPGGDQKLPGGGNVMSVHPHNASLQIWLELGGIGAVLWALLLAGLWLRAAALPQPSARAAATGLFLSALVVANLSFGIWQTWWMAALGLSGVIFALARQSRSK
jgi:O-antigen ligase